MPELNIQEGLEILVPGAQYDGHLDNTKESYDSIKWLDPRPKPTWEDVYEAAMNALRRHIASFIDMKTKEIIFYHFEYNGVKFFMPPMWQFDVLNLYMMKELLKYPYKLKVGSRDDGSCVYYEIKDAAEFDNLYKAVFMFVKNALDEGRKLKDQLPLLGQDELENWKDPRGPVEYDVEII